MINKTDLKIIGASTLCVIDFLFGKVDNLFILLLILMIADILLGIADACYTKTLSSDRMRKGIFRKIGIFIVIAIAVRIDICILDAIPEGIVIADKQVTIRCLFLSYFSICELLSCFENLHILGVPIPKALEKVLKTVVDTTTNEENPTKLVEYIKEIINVFKGNQHKINKSTDEQPKEQSTNTDKEKEYKNEEFTDEDFEDNKADEDVNE